MARLWEELAVARPSAVLRGAVTRVLPARGDCTWRLALRWLREEPVAWGVSRRVGRSASGDR